MSRRPEPEVRPETPGAAAPVVPRDLPDQQAGAHDGDPLDVPGQPGERPEDDDAEVSEKSDEPVPDEPSD